MIKPKEESPLSLLVRKPWYVSVIFSAMVFAFLRYGVPLILQPEASTGPVAFGDFTPMKAMVANALYKLAPLAWLFCLAIPFSLAHSFRNKRNLNKQSSVDSIKDLTWREFEWLVSEAYRRKGWQVTESLDRGPDGGIDLTLRKPGQVILVQCKQWRTSKVGAPKVRELFGVIAAEKATGGIFVTSGTYTRDALAFAKGKPLELIDGPALLQLIKGVQKKSVIQKLDNAVDQLAAKAHASSRPEPKQESTPVQSPIQEQTVPACPKCGAPMILRTARKGAHAGQQFYGCSKFPACRGTLPVKE